MESMESLVLTELGDHLEAADRLVAGYAREYIAWLRGGRQGGTPKPPVGLHPRISQLARELVLDAAAMSRRVAA